MGDLPASYLDAHRYDGAAIQRDRAEDVVPCAVQPRDVAVLRDVWRYKFLTAPQLRELWWPGRTERAGQRRLRMLFDAGYVERFRPITRRGSFPWTYQLAGEGHRLLQRAGVIPVRERFNRRSVYDYGHILHEIQLNAWVLAYRRAVGSALVSWEGETHIEPPPETRTPQLRFDDDWSAEDLRDPRARLVRPDAVLEVERDDSVVPWTVFVEYDRTRRVDKNYEKFRRYDAFLNWWWRHTEFVDAGAPFVVFVCQDRAQCELFVNAADRELSGHRWHPSVSPNRYEYVGRRRILFKRERDAHAGDLAAWRVPAFPADHPDRVAQVRRVRLSEPARVRFEVLIKSKGRKVGKKCVKATRKNRRRKRCTRLTRKGTFTRSAPAGRSKVAFSGRIRRKALKRRGYTIRATPTDAAGNSGKARSLSITIVR